ncbi:MAG: GAF domain-containing protein [Desulfobacteraceae bacterium]|nr:GAF domain-containing protein [Desulfobacteraceae bacterium]
MDTNNNTVQDRYLSLFQEVTHTLTSTFDVETVLHLIVEKIPTVLGLDAATVRLLDPRENRLQLVAAHGLGREYLNRGPIDAEKSVVTALTGKPVAVFDATTDPCNLYARYAIKEGVKSILVTPIVFQQQVRGVLRLISRTPRRFKKSEIAFVKALAEQCGIAIENARIHGDNLRQLSYFKTLNEIGKAINATLQLDEVLDMIVKELPRVMELKGCSIRLLDPVSGRLRLMASSGLSRRYLERGSIDDDVSTRHALRGESMFIFDAARDPKIRYPEETRREQVGSILAIPIVVEKKIIGILRLLTSRKRRFTDAEVSFAMAIGEQGGIAIRNSMNFEKKMALVAQLERHEQFLQNIFDGLKADLFVLDSDYRIVMVNKVFLKNHGMEESQVIGRHFGKILRIGEAREKLLRRLKQGTQTVSFTSKVADDTGGFYLEVMATPMYRHHDDGRIDFIIGTIRDITDHVRLRKELRNRERLQGVVEMAGTVAHELNNPLAIVLSAARLLKKDLQGSGQSFEDLEIIMRNLDRLSVLIERMTRITEYKSKRYLSGVDIIDMDTACGKKV